MSCKGVHPAGIREQQTSPGTQVLLTIWIWHCDSKLSPESERLSTLPGSENSRQTHRHKSSWSSESVTVDCLLKDCPLYHCTRIREQHTSPWTQVFSMIQVWHCHSVSGLSPERLSTLPGSENSRPAHGRKPSWWSESDTVTVDCLMKDCPPYQDQRTAAWPTVTKSYQSNGGSPPEPTTVYQCHW